LKNGGLVFSPKKQDKKQEKEEKQDLFISLFGDYFFPDSLRLAISKNIHK